MNGTARIAARIVTVVLAVQALAGCATGVKATTCDQYMVMSNADKVKALRATMAKPPLGDQDSMWTLLYDGPLRRYCSEKGHGDDKLMDLELGVG